jgi:hypothetical protein
MAKRTSSSGRLSKRTSIALADVNDIIIAPDLKLALARHFRSKNLFKHSLEK